MATYCESSPNCESYYRLVIDQGATLVQRFVWHDANDVPVPLTDYTARMQVRPSIESETVTLELTTENGRISLGGVNGTIDLLVQAADTAALEPGDYVYDLEMVETVGGIVTRLVWGDAVVTAEVTR